MSQILPNKNNKKIIKISKSDFAESCLWLNGNPYSLKDYPHMRTIYNFDASDIVMMFSRQTSKSTTGAGLTVTNSCLVPGYRTMYIAPTVEQARVWSHDRLAPFIEGSPWIKKHYMSSNLIQNVWTQQKKLDKQMEKAIVDVEKLKKKIIAQAEKIKNIESAM